MTVALASRLDREITVEFGYVPWGASVERLEDLDAEGKRAVVRELGEVDRLGLRRVGLGSVYHPDVTSAFVDFLAAAGVSTVHEVSRDAPSDRALAAWGPGHIIQLARDADHETAQAVLIPETALHTTELLGELERLLGKPVLTATQVTIWQALDQLGRHPTQSGLGTLFLG